MEKLIQLVASLPSTSKNQQTITDTLVTDLWNVLRHPPLSYASDRFQYRDASGAYNVPLFRCVLLI